jgi:hypothetical protein
MSRPEHPPDKPDRLTSERTDPRVNATSVGHIDPGAEDSVSDTQTDRRFIGRTARPRRGPPRNR